VRVDCFSQRLFVMYTHERDKNAHTLSVLSVLDDFVGTQSDAIETILCTKLMRFMMMRAENFFILRRKPVDVSRFFGAGLVFSLPISCRPCSVSWNAWHLSVG
jgi:hypothetical protein